jgi:hypothetical protein
MKEWQPVEANVWRANEQGHARDMSRDDINATRSAASPGGFIVRIAGEGRWRLPSAAEDGLRRLDDAVTRAVDDACEDDYERMLAAVCAFVRRRGEVLHVVDCAGDSDITVPPPALSLAGAVEALFDGGGLGTGPYTA